MHCISVPADVYPIAPSGEQNAPGVTGFPAGGAGGVVFGAGGLVVVCGAPGVGFFPAGPVVGTLGGATVGTVAVAAGTGDISCDADADGDAEEDGDAEAPATSQPVCWADVPSGPQAASPVAVTDAAARATMRRRMVIAASSTCGNRN
ncbi:hypothetical protein GCM10022255_074980 [Dactylosporangium darangshiense]|uniref:Uncharacterized protein n=1 Tax=Dactylosporangium darangshiense TaxID=579108 RepID=A0ABP8DJG5_9ACTN